ncbi:hypothetical protein E4U32_002225 [Claviceps aff. humidiphila group G2b]|nr:hypothetical protein E4U32_002225 [Claviceps aff. humidiphila group G2b]
MSVLASYEYKALGILLCVVDVCGFVCVSLKLDVSWTDMESSCVPDPLEPQRLKFSILSIPWNMLTATKYLRSAH